MAAILLTMVASAVARNADCDHRLHMKSDMKYYVESPGYPGNYTSGVECRWKVTCPAGYNCRLQCNYVAIPSSSGCTEDRILVFRSGDSQANAQPYCGSGRIHATSTEQKLEVALKTSKRSPGGRFFCTVDTVKARVLVSSAASCTCGSRSTTRIVGGMRTTIKDYPMMAGIVDNNLKQIVCGAVVIDKRYVMTAAHCLTNLGSPQNAIVVVGTDDVNSAGNSTKVLAARRFIIHPNFQSSNYDYDIGLVEVFPDMTFSDSVSPVCLPFKFTNRTIAGNKVTLLGWGTLFPGGPKSETLMTVDTRVIDTTTCRITNPSVTPRQLCTYSPGKDACQDDDGGPALYLDPENSLLFSLGIISKGVSCAGRTPSVNTRVPVLLDWITQNAPDSNFCIK